MPPPNVTIAGAAEVTARLGEWPSFHDSEIIRVHIERDGRSTVTIRLIDTKFHTNCVTFSFEKIAEMSLGGEEINVQNVIFDLHIETDNELTTVSFAPCFGLAGYIEAKSVSVSLD